MRKGTMAITWMGMAALASAVYAGDGFHMKCPAPECGYESEVTMGGGMMTQGLTGYCRACKKFVHLQWTRENSPLVNPGAAKVPPPKPVGEIVDVRTGGVVTCYACPSCKGPFAEIKAEKDIKHCPACTKPGFAVDETKGRIAFD